MGGGTSPIHVRRSIARVKRSLSCTGAIFQTDWRKQYERNLQIPKQNSVGSIDF